MAEVSELNKTLNTYKTAEALKNLRTGNQNLVNKYNETHHAIPGFTDREVAHDGNSSKNCISLQEMNSFLKLPNSTVANLEMGYCRPNESIIKKYKEVSGKNDIAQYFKGMKAKIKTWNENWLIFLSGIISSVPIAILISFTNFNNGLPIYFGWLVGAFVASVAATGLFCAFTAKMIEVKERISQIKNLESSNARIDGRTMELSTNFGEYKADEWLSQTDNEKNLNLVFWFSIFFFVIVVLLLIVCWHYVAGVFPCNNGQ